MKSSNILKLFLLYSFFQLDFCVNSLAQKGLFAGNSKSLISKRIPYETRENPFKTWQNIGGYFLEFNNGIARELLIDFYQKGNTQIAVFLSHESGHRHCQIEDILEIKNMPPHSYIQSATCAIGKNEPNIEILALEQDIKGKGKILKAWRASRDKLHFLSISTKNLNCVIEGAD